MVQFYIIGNQISPNASLRYMVIDCINGSLLCFNPNIFGIYFIENEIRNSATSRCVHCRRSHPQFSTLLLWHQ